ncbi:MAG: pantetheine-phosphate adenylyltransferase [Candidatus Marinimicrobia bacterium]|nr:pantetheine-phosphate adenylyltransferase [Candidatus Neomarinimicrobiota bacterium]|tara:strand:- start:22778 stop:23254 length:477 start_codon:yes stop_codon:yes gene_type:complete
MNKAIYPGSFDPITYGHMDIIKRCSKIYDKLIVGVIKDNNKKNFLFDDMERRMMIESSLNNYPNVEVKVFNSLLVDFAVQEESKIIIRGLRALSDFEYEFQMALMNRKLNDNISTLFMMPHEKFTHISSSLLKEVIALGGDVKDYAPESIIKKVKDRI